MLFDILEYICKTNNTKLQNQNVAILMDVPDEIVMKQLLFIAKDIKMLKIVTTSKNSFSYIENELYEKYGIAIQITNNKIKSLSNVDIIINFDFNEERISEYNINPNATIINVNNKIESNIRNFKCKNINNYEISFDNDNFQDNLVKSNFDSNILYESYIYRKDTYENIRKQLQKDEVKIVKIV